MSRSTRDLLTLAGIALACVACAVVPAAGATLQEIKERGYIVVATEDDNPPFEYAANGGRAGYDQDLLVIFTQSTGIAIHQEIVPWQDILPGIASGKYDVAVTAAVITPARAKRVDFTMPVAESTMAYMKLKADNSILSRKDLAGKSLGVQEGGAALEVLPSLKDELRKSGGKLGKVVAYRSYAEAYQDLVKRRIDAVINNRDSLAQLVATTSGVFELGEPVGPKSYAAWAVKKGNRALLEFLNAYLAEQKASGTFARLQMKYNLSIGVLPDRPLPARGQPAR